MFLMADLRGSLIESALDLLTLIVQVRLLLLQPPELVIESSLHFLFIPSDLILNLNLLLVEERTLKVDTRLIVVHARHTRIVSRLHLRAIARVVIPECLYPLLDLISLLIVFLQLLLPLSLVLHVLHLLLLEGAPQLVSVLLDLPFVHLLLSPYIVVPLFLLLRALNAEVLLSLVLIQLVVMDLNALCLVLVLITLWD